MTKDLTVGSPLKLIITFAIPMIVGNLFQQLYNLVDSIVVGQFIGKNALAAVSSAYTVMVFVTSVIIGLCMGASVLFSQLFGAGELEKLKRAITTSFIFTLGVTVCMMAGTLIGIESIIRFMNIPPELYSDTKIYLQIIFIGLIFTFLYNAISSLLRALGDSKTPLYFLILAAILNIILDLIFVLVCDMGVKGVAIATLIAQGVAAVLCILYSIKKLSILHMTKQDMVFDRTLFGIIARYSILTSIQQSIMNFGILLVQGLVNSFGTVAMAAFGAAVKIDGFAYMPVQDFGNAFSTYVAQNKGAKEEGRIHEGIKCTVKLICIFCFIISVMVVLFAKELMLIFINPKEYKVLAIGIGYLRVIAPFYVLIGFLFMFYGLYRGLGTVKISIILTIISLGTRVILAYLLAAMPKIGLVGIWWAVPIGWALADVVGYRIYRRRRSILNFNKS